MNAPYCPSIPACCEDYYDYNAPGTPYPPLPTGAPIVSNGSVNQPTQTPFSYQIVATNNPTSYGASGLPAGLFINAVTGVISGTIASASLLTYEIEITATNANGTGSGTLTIYVIEDAPVITSPLMAFIGNGILFNYQITATNSPTSFGASDLPAGLSVSTSTGLISGTITGATIGATYSIPISATNATGTGNATLVITVAQSLGITFAQNPSYSGANLQGVYVALDGSSYVLASLGVQYNAFSQFKFKVVVANGSYSLTSKPNVGIDATFSDSGHHRAVGSGSSLSVYGDFTITSGSFLSYGQVQNGLANATTWVGQSGAFSQTVSMSGSTSTLVSSNGYNYLNSEASGAGNVTGYYTETIINLS